MPKNLLLADDSITIQKVVGITFANEDFRVTTVDNGDDALARARELKPDVILADVVMPRKNGYEVCETVKADPALRHIPVLLLAGTFEAFDEARARAARADGHISKPFESGALINKVKELVQGGAPIAPAAGRPAAPAPAPRPAAAAPGVARPPGAAPAPGLRPGAPIPPGALRPGAPAPAGARPGMPPPGVAPRPGAPLPPGARPPGPGAPPPGARPPYGMPPPGARPPGPALAGARPPGPGMPAPGARPGAPMAAPGARPPPGFAAPAARPAAPAAARPVAPAPAARPAPAPAAKRDPFGFGVGAPAAAPQREDDFGDLDAAAPAARLAATAPAPARPALDELSFDVETEEPTPAKPARAPIELPEGPATEPELAPMHAFVPPAATTGHRPDGGEAALRAALSEASREVIERVVWEVVPQLAETIIRENLERLVKQRQGS